MTAFAFDNTYARDLPGFYVAWKPVAVPAPRLLFLNEPLATELGLDAAPSGPRRDAASRPSSVASGSLRKSSRGAGTATGFHAT